MIVAEEGRDFSLLKCCTSSEKVILGHLFQNIHFKFVECRNGLYNLFLFYTLIQTTMNYKHFYKFCFNMLTPKCSDKLNATVQVSRDPKFSTIPESYTKHILHILRLFIKMNLAKMVIS